MHVAILDAWPGRTAVLTVLLAPVLYFAAALLIYALRAALGMQLEVDREVEARGRSLLLGHTVRQGFAFGAGPIERALLGAEVTADALTLAGTAFCAAGALLIALGDLTVGGMLVLGSAGFDFFDGRIARLRGSAGAGGEFLDSTLDRWSDSFCMAGAAFLFRGEPATLVAALTAMTAAAIVPYARAKAEALGAPLSVGLMQRPERLVLLSVSAMSSTATAGLWPAGLADGAATFRAGLYVLAVATTITAVQRTVGGRRLLAGRS